MPEYGCALKDAEEESNIRKRLVIKRCGQIMREISTESFIIENKACWIQEQKIYEVYKNLNSINSEIKLD